MKKGIIIGLIASLCISSIVALMSFKSVTNEENYIVVRVFECQDGLLGSFIIISDGVKIIKTIELKVLKQKTQEENMIKIVQTLNEIKNQGYTLISSNNGGVNLNLITNYVFEKK
jgi:hypothetical protein